MNYRYMIKTLELSPDKKYGVGYNNFKYPLKKGIKIIALDWNSKPECGGGIHGLIHETKKHSIQNNHLWIILKYEKGTEVIIEDEKIKVPYAWVEAWGTPQEMQILFEKLTGKPYVYPYAIQVATNDTTQLAENISTQVAGYRSNQTAGDDSTQIAGCGSSQVAGNKSIQKTEEESTQTAGDKSTQIAGYSSIQIAEDQSTQTAGNKSQQTAKNDSIQRAGYESIQKAQNDCFQIAKDNSTQIAWDNSAQIAKNDSAQTAKDNSTQTAGNNSTQRAGEKSTQTAGYKSTQMAGNGSVSIIRGNVGYCEHNGKVLQVLVYYDHLENQYVFLSKVIDDNKKHKLEVIKEYRNYILKDTIIE